MDVIIFFLFLLIAFFFLEWGIREKKAPIYLLGILFLLVTGIAFTATGIDTTKIAKINVSSDGGGGFDLVPTYQNIGVSDFVVQWLVWAVIIIAMVSSLLAFRFLPQRAKDVRG